MMLIEGLSNQALAPQKHKIIRDSSRAPLQACKNFLGCLWSMIKLPTQAVQGLSRLRRASRRCARWALLADGPSPSELELGPT